MRIIQPSVTFSPDKSSCRIVVAPAQMAFSAYAEMVDTIARQRPHRIALHWLGDTWRTEIIANIDDLLERLTILMHETCPSDRFIRKTRTINSLAVSHPFRSLIEFWKANGRVIDLERDAQVVDDHTYAKFMVIRRDQDSSQLHFSQFGKTDWYVYLDRRWTTKCIGQRVADQPDYEYGRWVSTGFDKAMRAAVPTLTDADTMVKSAGAVRRLQYTRLTLPVVGKDGTPQLLSTSLRDECVDLRQPIH